MWYTVFDSIPKPEYTILLIQKNDAKIMTGSRRITYNKLDPPILFAPVTPHPRRRLVCANPHTTRHKPPHHAPRSVSAPHCRDSRRATPDATGRHSTRHEQGHRKPGNATPAATGRHSSAPFRARCPHSRGQPVDNLLITCGKPLLARGYEDGVVDNSTTYPHVIHRLSTGYPQVKTSHAMRGLLT